MLVFANQTLYFRSTLILITMNFLLQTVFMVSIALSAVGCANKASEVPVSNNSDQEIAQTLKKSLRLTPILCLLKMNQITY